MHARAHAGLFGALSVTHLLFYRAFDEMSVSLMTGVCQMGSMYLLGTLVYTTHFPESAWPQRFDLFFSSHQWWHVFVVLAAITIAQEALLKSRRRIAAAPALPERQLATRPPSPHSCHWCPLTNRILPARDRFGVDLESISSHLVVLCAQNDPESVKNTNKTPVVNGHQA